jgi:hypothetical protein
MTTYRDKRQTLTRTLKHVLYGMTIHEWVREIEQQRGSVERLFVLVVFGDLLAGVPILPPYYCLQLLPYIVPHLEGWRHSMLRERDLIDLIDFET